MKPGDVRIDSDAIRRLRKDRVLSQRDLARTAGVTHATVWRLENGFDLARPSTVRKLAAALGVEPKELIREGE